MGKFINLTDRVFGNMTVISLSPIRYGKGTCCWVCYCALCGSYTTKVGSQLTYGNITQCGCQTVPDLVGKVFGLLTVTALAQERGRNGDKEWICQCSCGKETTVRGYALKIGITKSCGCYHRLVVKTYKGSNKHNIFIVQSFIDEHHSGGKCLSTEYKHCKSKLTYQCKKMHTWIATWNSVHRGSWCPICSKGLSERICKKLSEEVFGVIFAPNVRFYYDINRKHKCYELDGYNEEHKLAFEYNGKQHYTYSPYFPQSEQDFLELQQRDINKAQWCKDNNITLIVVPHIYSYKDENKMKKFLEEQKEILQW